MIRPGGAFATVSEMAPFPDVACGKGRMPLVRPQPANPRIVVSRRVNLGGVRSTPGSNSLPSICSMATSTALADQPDVLAWGDAGEQHHLLYPRQRPRRAGVNAYAVALPLRELPCQRLERLPARVLRLEPLQLYPMPFGAYDALPVEDVDERKLGVAVRHDGQAEFHCGFQTPVMMPDVQHDECVDEVALAQPTHVGEVFGRAGR